MGGFQGSGKSTLAARISIIFNANIISADAIRYAVAQHMQQVEPDFVQTLCAPLIEKSLKQHSHTIIDANAHHERLQAIKSLLRNDRSLPQVVIILLKTSPEVLKERVRSRPQREGYYQGTEKDLEGSLAKVSLNPQDYDFIIDTDQITADKVSELALEHFKKQGLLDSTSPSF